MHCLFDANTVFDVGRVDATVPILVMRKWKHRMMNGSHRSWLGRAGLTPGASVLREPPLWWLSAYILHLLDWLEGRSVEPTKERTHVFDSATRRGSSENTFVLNINTHTHT